VSRVSEVIMAAGVLAALLILTPVRGSLVRRLEI